MLEKEEISIMFIRMVPMGVPNTPDDVLLGSTYHPCGETHSAESNSDFAHGYMYKAGLLGPDKSKRIDVVIWRGEKGDNIHCTTNLNIDSWTDRKILIVPSTSYFFKRL